MYCISPSPSVSELYPWGITVWQDDDGKKIHRLQDALGGIRHRNPYENQAPKMADVWPIENVCVIIKQNLDGQDFNNIRKLRAGIRAWR